MSAKKFEGLLMVSVNKFNQGTEDKNGKMPVILNILAGKSPNRIVLSGSVAENAGFEVGNSYLAQCRETETDSTYGRQFVWNVVQKASMTDIINARKDLGQPVVFDAAEVPEEEHQRISANNGVIN